MSAPEQQQELTSAAHCRMNWWLRFTPRSVLIGWKWRRWSNEKRYRLEDLNPVFAEAEPTRDYLASAFAMLSAFFVWLALKNPGDHERMFWIFAVVSWAVFLTYVMRKKRKRSIIKRKDGAYAFVLDHRDFEPEALDAFLTELKQRILQEQGDDGAR